jgi:hypothetical protein
MSSDAGAAKSGISFEDRLEKMYDRYRRRNLESHLDELAETMEDTILQRDLAKAFFDAPIIIDDEAKSAVTGLADLLREEDYDAVEAELPDVRDCINEQENRVGNDIQKLRLDRLDTVRAMRRLNERVDRVDGTRLEALEQLLNDWNWRPHVESEAAQTLDQRREDAKTYGAEMGSVFETLQEELFGPYVETDLWPIVESLLDEERLTYAALGEEERRQLTESELAEYIELSLS